MGHYFFIRNVLLAMVIGTGVGMLTSCGKSTDAKAMDTVNDIQRNPHLAEVHTDTLESLYSRDPFRPSTVAMSIHQGYPAGAEASLIRWLCFMADRGDAGLDARGLLEQFVYIDEGGSEKPLLLWLSETEGLLSDAWRMRRQNVSISRRPGDHYSLIEVRPLDR